MYIDINNYMTTTAKCMTLDASSGGAATFKTDRGSDRIAALLFKSSVNNPDRPNSLVNQMKLSCICSVHRIR
jgi:hypothetical protein